MELKDVTIKVAKNCDVCSHKEVCSFYGKCEKFHDEMHRMFDRHNNIKAIFSANAPNCIYFNYKSRADLIKIKLSRYILSEITGLEVHNVDSDWDFSNNVSFSFKDTDGKVVGCSNIKLLSHILFEFE